MKILFNIHLLELKYRTIYLLFSFLGTVIVCLNYKLELLYVISKPFLNFNTGFIYTKLTEPFFIYFKLIFFFSFFSIFFLLLYFYSFFFFKALYNYQLKLILLFLCIFYNFLLIFYFLFISYIIPFIFNFFILYERLGLNKILLLTLEAKLEDYIYFFGFLIFLIILSTHSPIIFLFLILNIQYLNILVLRKYLYIFMFIIFISIMPPDILFQFFFLPLFILFIEFFLFIIYLIINYIEMAESGKAVDCKSIEFYSS